MDELLDKLSIRAQLSAWTQARDFETFAEIEQERGITFPLILVQEYLSHSLGGGGELRVLTGIRRLAALKELDPDSQKFGRIPCAILPRSGVPDRNGEPTAEAELHQFVTSYEGALSCRGRIALDWLLRYIPNMAAPWMATVCKLPQDEVTSRRRTLEEQNRAEKSCRWQLDRWGMSFCKSHDADKPACDPSDEPGELLKGSQRDSHIAWTRDVASANESHLIMPPADFRRFAAIQYQNNILEDMSLESPSDSLGVRGARLLLLDARDVLTPAGSPGKGFSYCLELAPRIADAFFHYRQAQPVVILCEPNNIVHIHETVTRAALKHQKMWDSLPVFEESPLTHLGALTFTIGSSRAESLTALFYSWRDQWMTKTWEDIQCRILRLQRPGYLRWCQDLLKVLTLPGDLVIEVDPRRTDMAEAALLGSRRYGGISTTPFTFYAF